MVMGANVAYHEPVLCQAVVDQLVVDRTGVYLDATAGGAGHSSALLGALDEGGVLWAVDRDDDAVARVQHVLSSDARVRVRKGSFADLERLMESESIFALNGALFDLGVSSHQIDTAHRGFSYRADGPLDMRMDCEQFTTAADLVAEASEEDLLRILRDYGEERQAKGIAKTIVRQRQEKRFETTADLRRAVEVTRPQMLNKTLARVFQALRIAVNGELEQLTAGLCAAVNRLTLGGRVAVIAYHSLEDRIVKQFMAERMKGCICPPRMPVCACGKKPEFAKVGRGRIRPSEDEVAHNSRARSAILRVYEKIEGNT